MKLMRRLPTDFFTTLRLNNDPTKKKVIIKNKEDDKIYPIKWSKEVLSGSKKALVKGVK